MSSSTQRPPANDGVRVLVRALDQAGDVLDHVHPDNTDAPTPCTDWNVGALAAHLVATPGNFLTMMRGEQPDWSAPPPELSGGWGGEFRVHADDLAHHWHELDGDPPVPAGMQVAELAVHTWDLATALGRPTSELDPEVARVAVEFLRASLKPEMRGNVFGAERPAPPGAGPYEELAAFAGREL